MRAVPALALLVWVACCAPHTMSPSAPPTTPTSAPTMPTPAPSAPQPAPRAAVLPAPPLVRVLLTQSAVAGRARVRVTGAWTLVADGGATLHRGASLDAPLNLGAAIPELGASVFPADAELRPESDGDLRLDTTVGGRTESRSYPGALRVERGPNGRWHAAIALGVEAYVACVVSAEIPAAFPREAQRAQAVNARTYALASTHRTAPDAPFVLADVGAVDQEFTGLAAMAEHRRIAADAAQSTSGVVLTEDGVPFVAYYHSTCGGVTCPASVAFGRYADVRALAGGVTCPWCESSKYFRWTAKIPGENVVKAADLTGSLTAFAVAETTAGGRAATFEVRAGGKSRRVRAADLRLRVGASALRSVLLDDVSIVGGDLVVQGRGWGHGVGLCQIGAKTLAEKGLSAEAILAMYYPGSKLEARW